MTSPFKNRDPASYLNPGLVTPGNIDIKNRPLVKNRDGSVSTVKSMSIGTDKGEVLIPQVVGGKVVTPQQAIGEYRRTGKHLGVFKTPRAANGYAVLLHQQQASMDKQAIAKALAK